MERRDLIKEQEKVTLLRAEGKYKETIEASYELLELGLELIDNKSILTAHINSAASFYCIGDIEEAFNSIDNYNEVCRVHGECLALDIDNFKGINDEFGHLFGDEAIKYVSNACASVLEEDQMIGRYGCDEFVVILKDNSLEEGLIKAKQIMVNRI